jgi:putative DNA primase/helicase
MSYIKEHLFRVQEGIRDPSSALYDIATALGGEVAGRTKILAPSPGADADDRSMVIFFSTPWRPEAFWIYACDGEMRDAKAMVRAKLALVAPGEKPDNSAAALRIWEETAAAAGSSVATYLRSRGITLPIPPTLRFHGRLKHTPTGGVWPAMVALVTDVSNKPVAVHRTWLQPGGKGKAPVEPNKMSFGPCEGNAIRLGPLSADLLIGEGIETCLSAMMADGRSAWAAISAYGLKELKLPDEVRRVGILVDGDRAGERAAELAGNRWIREGRQVLLHRAPPGKDFNDVLMEL